MFHEKVANLAPNSAPQVLFLESVILGYAAKCGLSVLSHRVVKHLCTQGSRFKKVNKFCRFAEDIPRFHFLFLFICFFPFVICELFKLDL